MPIATASVPWVRTRSVLMVGGMYERRHCKALRYGCPPELKFRLHMEQLRLHTACSAAHLGPALRRVALRDGLAEHDFLVAVFERRIDGCFRSLAVQDVGVHRAIELLE